jgi:citrate lyase subunit beta / citryl-CoA lyase
MRRRSQLYVPANDVRKMAKSTQSPCDSVIFDLEDAVPPAEKNTARKVLRRVLRELQFPKEVELCVRINPMDSHHSLDDISEFTNEDRISTIVVPKSEERLDDLHRSLGKDIIPIIETAKGLLRVEDVLRSDGVVAVAYGAADFANSLGGKMEEYLGNVYVKTKIAVSARAYNFDPIDNVYFDLANPSGFEQEALKSKALGYVGKQVIHPSQVELANKIFSPTAEEVAEARKIIEAYQSSATIGKGATTLDKKLIDAVHYRNAKKLLDQFGEQKS